MHPHAGLPGENPPGPPFPYASLRQGKGGWGDLGSDNTSFLAALQLADSFFPIGTYAHSQGLEGMVRRGWVRTAGDVEELLANQLAWSVLPADGVALLNAHRAAGQGDLAALLDIDRHLYSLKLPAELRAASCQHGRRLLQETAAFSRHSLSHPMHAGFLARVESKDTPGTGAVAMGVVSRCLDIPEQWGLLAFCHSYLVGVLSAGLRMLPMTHRQVQDILHRLRPLVLELAGEVGSRSWQDMTSFTPELDIASMTHEGTHEGHESDDLRMFAS